VLSDSQGVFALGYVRDDSFVIAALDRSETDLKTDLKSHLHGPFQHFKFVYALSKTDAFQRHCEIYHECVDLENRAHPSPPQDMDLTCPCCKLQRSAAQI